jgi:hypothetical protein
MACAVVLLLQACSDSTSPSEGTFQVVVSPDTVSKTGQTAGTAHVILRNGSRVAVAIDWCNVELEAETSPGVWPVPRAPTVACIAEVLAPQSERTQDRSVGSLPGRYRFAYPYRFVEPSAAQSAPRLMAYSNVIVIMP